MEDARAMARTSKAGRVARLLGANNSSASVMASEGADGTPVSGGVSGGSNGTTPDGSASRGRLDKPKRARGGAIQRAKGGLVGASGPRFHIVDRDGLVVGGANNRSRANLSRDKRDNDYGGYRFQVKPNPDHPDNVGQASSPQFAQGGRVKGRTNVTVIVAPQGGQGGADPLSAAMGAKMGAMAGGGAGGPQTGAPMPPGAMPAAPPAPPAGGPPGQPPQHPPMGGQPVPMRKRGGSVKRMVDGEGSGLGRIADAANQKAFMRANGGPCWSGYQSVGTKKQGKKSVPDCRPS